jgi:hypothetical protein
LPAFTGAFDLTPSFLCKKARGLHPERWVGRTRRDDIYSDTGGGAHNHPSGSECQSHESINCILLQNELQCYKKP